MNIDEIKTRIECVLEWLGDKRPSEREIAKSKAELTELLYRLKTERNKNLNYPLQIWDKTSINVEYVNNKIVITKVNE